MGSEIDESRFTRDDFHAFARRLKAETETLRQWIREGRVADETPRIGLELETWLVDAAGRPAPRNAEIMGALPDEPLAPELARYNLELNTAPQPLVGRPFSALAAELSALWDRLRAAAAQHGCRPAMVGILPSLHPEDLVLERMSGLKRYQALNEQVLLLRNRRPIHVDIDGPEPLRLTRGDVMLEAAATSVQLHLQVSPRHAARLYNASLLASAATMALAANSPRLFGRRLWEETRIPLFEQAVEVGPLHDGHAGPLARVTFGSGYARDALYNFFVENRQHYPVLLPVALSEPPSRLPHLVLHNGTVWRWNRPLVGFDADGRCHLRIEHRVMAAGPTIADMMANAAFYYGLVHGLLRQERSVEALLPFTALEHNFYSAARRGLEASVRWVGGTDKPLAGLIADELLPVAERGLEWLDVAADERRRHLGIVRERLRTGRTGAAWQEAWLHRHGRDLSRLTLAYMARQESGEPVHTWDLGRE